LSPVIYNYRSRLSEHGVGQLPEGIVDKEKTYPTTVVSEKSLLNLYRAKEIVFSSMKAKNSHLT